MASKNILVTGAGGFIGSNLVSSLAEDREPVYSLTHSLNDFNLLKETIRKVRPEKIVHCAGVVNLERSYPVAKACIDSNISGTLNLLEAAKETGLTQLVYLSTVEVYGDSSIPFKETEQEKPPSPYAISKLAGEHLCQFYARIFGFSVCVLRIATCYGPRQKKERLIPWIIQSCLSSRPVHLTSGHQKRDFIYVEDVVEGIGNVLASKKPVQGVFNLGDSKSASIRSVVEMIKKITKSNSMIHYGSVQHRPFELSEWKTSSAKAKRLLGWKAQTSLEDGLRKTVGWYEKRIGR